MKFANIEAIVFVFILFFLIVWALPKCRSNQDAGANTEVVAPPTPSPQTVTPTVDGKPTTPADAAAPIATTTPPVPNAGNGLSGLVPKPMSRPTLKKTPADQAAPSLTPNPGAESTVPFDPDGNGSPTTGASGTTKVFTITADVKIRAQPGLDGKVVGHVPKGTALSYLYVKTDKTQKITIEGQDYNEPWIKIRAPRGTEGWVYGGTVRFYKN